MRMTETVVCARGVDRKRNIRTKHKTTEVEDNSLQKT
jgi:hypothetical protein